MRYILDGVAADLRKKMVFIGGPRQVGKTTLAKHVLETMYPGGRYLNWDYDEDRQAIRNS
jgi:predicted AAA+ superfamily ATPase